jgi:small-conductance mechanosensitive channel
MTAILDLQLSGAGLLRAMIAGLLLVLVLKLLRRLPVVLLGKGTYRSFFQRAFPIAESLIWVLFTIWALGLIFVDLLSQRLALLTLLTVSVFWLSWFAAKDFIAGLILRLQDHYEIGQRIHLDNIEGSILRVGFLGMDIERTNGRVTRIPYGKLTGTIHSRRPPETSSRYQFRVQLPKEASLEETVSRIRESALISPWSSPDREPQIRRISETDSAYIFEVGVSAIAPDYFEAIERDIRSHLT